MHTRAPRWLGLALATALAANAHAQRVLTVPGQYRDLNAAIAAARAGDEILIQNNATYPPISVNIGITIRAATRATIRGLPGVPAIIQVPPGQEARFERLNFQAVFFAAHAVRVAGVAAFDRCNMAGAGVTWPTATAHLEAGSQVVMSRCTVSQGSLGGSGVKVDGGWASLVDCTITGAFAHWDLVWGGGPGLEILAGGSVQAAGCVFTGGDADPFNGYPGGAGIEVADGNLWIADSRAAGGANANGGAGDGIRVAANARVVADGCTFSAGAQGRPGAAVVGAVQSGTVLRPTALPPIVAGQTWTLPVRGRPGELVFVAASDQLAPSWLGFAFLHPVWLGGANLDLVAWTLLDAQGNGSLSTAVPASLGAGTLYYQLGGVAGPWIESSVAVVERF